MCCLTPIRSLLERPRRVIPGPQYRAGIGGPNSICILDTPEGTFQLGSFTLAVTDQVNDL